MTGSWTMDGFIYGAIILLIVPLAIFIYKEFINKGGK